MTSDSSWLQHEIPNPAMLSPTCHFCAKPGVCLIPFHVNFKLRMVIATYRCENGHEWRRVFRPEPKAAFTR